MSSSPSSFQRPSSASPYQQADLPSYTPSVHAISSSPPFGDEKSSTSKLPYRFTTSPHAGPAVDRHALPAVPTLFQPPCMAARSHDNNTILTSPPSTLRSPSPPSPPRSTENLPVVKNSPFPHRETSKPPLVLRTPEPTEHPTEQPSDESPLSLPNPYDQGRDEDSATSPLAPPGISPISPQPSENADDLMDAIENLMVTSSS
ncbi:hypothetical protein PISMIDRAFT_15602 [Pisolithus microcarpus 441]|uniref:Uncharacterized protein n=1 Tax=Pisolithus microcarpus 441 TaxID=765257 RepID=A0A0C9Z2V5_9AGAM|nr:hypothetical protein PISMIDRAFT_15602 [Pisolithus microcarpus 441]